MAKLTKKQKAFEGKVDPNTHYGVDEAIGLVKSLATSKFDETVEIAINLGVDPRHADQMVRGVVNLPKGTARTSASRCSPRATRLRKPRRRAPRSSAPRI
jgi:large subunit ribosomal protein L1